jgi:hypothetical protein
MNKEKLFYRRSDLGLKNPAEICTDREESESKSKEQEKCANSFDKSSTGEKIFYRRSDLGLEYPTYSYEDQLVMELAFEEENQEVDEIKSNRESTDPRSASELEKNSAELKNGEEKEQN